MPFAGSKLKKIRESRNMSQFDLAKIIDCHPNQISAWECGGSPGLIYAERIASALDVGIIDLMESGDGEGAAV